MHKMKKIMLVFGTRPEAIKMAPLVKHLQSENKYFRTIVCVTGQHREMLDQVLSFFEITPDYDLNIMKSGQSLYTITARVLTELEPILTAEKPDIVLVHGDTSTSMAAALASFYQHIPVGHVEAGLRTYNMYSPWPEEMNRQITGRIASYHFAPTEKSRENLLKENVPCASVHVTGNTVIDALLHVKERLESSEDTEATVIQSILKSGYDVTRLSSNSRKLILITGHRRENFGAGFISICEAIKQLSEKYPDVDFLYPMHLNPNVRQPIQQVFGESAKSSKNVFFTEPLEYLSFVYLLSKSHIVLTDSGGIQEEAPGLGKPVLVMRDTTERPEAVIAGTVKLVGTDKTTILRGISDLLESPSEYARMSLANNPYGDGLACERICNILRNI